MIGITKLLTGTATVSAAMRADAATPAHLLQFSAENRPVLVWNSTSKCNLECRHCYADAYTREAGHELTTREARAFIVSLAAMPVPVLLFSGGEPLMRDDIFDLAALAVSKGMRIALSTNGTLITAAVAQRLKSAGFAYVGVSLDGTEKTHDRFRNRPGAFAEALAGLRHSAAAGLRTGVRFTLNRSNADELEDVLDLVEAEGFQRFCMYHLVYAGKGVGLADEDVTHAQSRAAVETLIARALSFAADGVQTEILTADNHADGVLVLKYVEKHIPSRVDEVRKLLEMSGGCSAGRKIAAVDPYGNVRPCQFWHDDTLGNVKERPFTDIWLESPHPLIKALRSSPHPLEASSRCARCAYASLCKGCRIRAAATGGLWRDDPQCYLTDAETSAQPHFA